MEQEKIVKFIKDIRKKHHLTQKQLADKYHVTYQAVSKWENGKNMPDTFLLKQMCKDFGVSLDELLEREIKNSNKNKTILILIIVILILSIAVALIFKSFSKQNDFQFKTLSAECLNFTISGNIAYNENKSAIYITNIKYCGGNDTEEYKEIECVLYESNNNIETKISSFKSNREGITLEEFLQDITLSVDNYEKTCKEYEENNLYLSINATDFHDKTIAYKIPLKLESCFK